MHKWVMVTLFSVACVMAVVFSITYIEPKEGGEPAAADELRFEAVNYHFDKEEYRVTLGSTMKLSLKNTEGIHGLGIDAYNVDLKVGDVVEVTFDKEGTFDIHCSVMCGEGHDGMVAKLIVEQAAAEPADTETKEAS